MTHLEETPNLSLSTSITKRAKYECMKWYCDIELDSTDKHSLYQLHKIIINSQLNTDFYIAKDIAEHALGCIKICPACEDCELLIIPSMLINACFVQDKMSTSKSSFKCPACLSCIYIDICDNHAVHDRNLMINNTHCNWWLFWAPRHHIECLPLPQSRLCKACLMESNIWGNDWTDWTRFKPLCDECTFECCLCSNIFCHNKHIGYHCIQCNLVYCKMCRDYFSSNTQRISDNNNQWCINCFFNLQKYVSYYPNLQDRLMFYNYFRLFFDDFLIPSNIISYIVAYINGSIIKCPKEKCIEYIAVSPPAFNHHHCYAPYIDQIVKCRFGHRNYIHTCTKCEGQNIVNSLSCIQYIMHSMPLPSIRIDYIYLKNKLCTKPLNTCCECIAYSDRMHKSPGKHEYDQIIQLNKVCYQCTSVCSDVRCPTPRLVCDTHSYSQCAFCGNIYCDKHLSNFNHYQADGDLFDHLFCCHCGDIFEAIRNSFFEKISFTIVDIIIFYVWNYRLNW